MELPWEICPFCATPVLGTRRENITLDDALQTPPYEEGELMEELGENG